MGVRYWAYFAAKLIAAAGILYASLGLLNPLVPKEPHANANTASSARPKLVPHYQGDPSIADRESAADIQIVTPEQEKSLPGPKLSNDESADTRALAPLDYGGQYLAFNLALMVWFLFGAGMLYLIVYDQRYRCRVCLRRLRMPVETGSRGFMLQLGRPRTEYICPYGHGTLKKEEFQSSGLENPEWTASSGDMWDELYAASDRARDEQ